MVGSAMPPAVVEKISVSLPKELVRYLEEYGRQNAVTSRSEVVARALRALREAELTESYKLHALEQPDPLVEASVADGLNPSSEHDW